jgi:hypothetical protein
MYTKVRFAVADAFLIVAGGTGLMAPSTQARVASTDTINPTQINERRKPPHRPFHRLLLGIPLS